MTIVGITGRKGHGKDTFAGIVQKFNPNFINISFAAPVKKLCRDIFKLSIEQTDSTNCKDLLLAAPIALDDYINDMKIATGLPIEPKKLIAKTSRQVLQFFGTDYVRTIAPNFWVDRLKDTVLRAPGNYLITDCRFPNEARVVRELKGITVRILRIDAPASEDQHQSELQSDLIIPDITLGIRTGDLRLAERCAYLVALGKGKALSHYDYPRIDCAINAYKDGASQEECSKILGFAAKCHKPLRAILDYYEIPLRTGSINRTPHIFERGIEKKTCSQCKHAQTLLVFSYTTRSWDGLASICSACKAQYNKDKFSVTNPERLCKTTKIGALKRKIDFTLTSQDIQQLWNKQRGLCAYTSMPMVWDIGHKLKISVDRIDSARGYTPDNIVLCSKTVNIMKQRLSVSELQDFAKAIVITQEKNMKDPKKLV